MSGLHGYWLCEHSFLTARDIARDRAPAGGKRTRTDSEKQ